MMTTQTLLRRGSSGPAVRRLQELLNSRLRPSPRLATNGHFGAETLAAAKRFQTQNWLSADGIVGPATWSALEEKDRFVILHNVTLVAQHTSTTCWSAALAMLLGVQACMSPGRARAHEAAGLFNDSELSKPENTQRFADSYGLTLLHGQTWTPEGLAALLRTHGPLMMNLLWNVGSFLRGDGSSGHMMIIAGIRGDGTFQGSTIRIYDPWPVGRGSVYSLTYGPFMAKIPASTYQLFYRH